MDSPCEYRVHCVIEKETPNRSPDVLHGCELKEGPFRRTSTLTTYFQVGFHRLGMLKR